MSMQTHIKTFIKQINDYLYYQKTEEMTGFALFLSIFDTQTGTLEYVSAGLPPPILFNKDNKITEQDAEDMPMGFSLDAVHPLKTLTLHQNETLFIYSKEMLKLKNKDGKTYSDARLKELIVTNNEKSLATLADIIIVDVRNHISPLPQMNDYVILSLKYL